VLLRHGNVLEELHCTPSSLTPLFYFGLRKKAVTTDTARGAPVLNLDSPALDTFWPERDGRHCGSL